MAENDTFFNDSGYSTGPKCSAEVLKQINDSDPDLAECYLEVTDMLVTDLGWDPVVASRYVLDWAADSLFSEEYQLRFMDYYE